VGCPPQVPITGARKTVKILGAIELWRTPFDYRQEKVFNATTYLGFLDQLARRYRRRGAILIQDNASCHKDRNSENPSHQQLSADPDVSVGHPPLNINTFLLESCTPSNHMLVHAVDEHAVKVKQDGWTPALAAPVVDRPAPFLSAPFSSMPFRKRHVHGAAPWRHSGIRGIVHKPETVLILRKGSSLVGASEGNWG